MESQKTIKLYVYVDGINDIPFYGSEEYEEFILSNGEQFILSNGFIFNVREVNEQIEIGSFRYDAKRMGGAPTISFTLMYEDCLDNFWSNSVYAVFNGEKYFLRQTPTSSKSNDDARYKHDVELISERAILDNVYFFDAVVGNPMESDKAVSNSTKVVFFGSVHEFAKRLNASLEYTKLLKWEDGVNEEGEPIKIANGYNVVVDEGIGSEEKLMSFEDQFFSNVLQEIYNTYEVPYYFEGKTIHIGFSDDVYPHIFSYGVDNALISITKNNANFKVVNRVTGKGSTDNIPFYYPNNSPKGIIEAEVNTTSEDFEVEIFDRDLYADKVGVNSSIERTSIDYVVQSIRLDAGKVNDLFSPNDSIDLDIRYKDDPFRFNVEISGQSSNKGEVYFELFLDDFVIYDGNEEYLQQLTEFVVYAESQRRSVYGEYYFDGFSSSQAKAKITNDINSIHVKLPFSVDGNAEQKLRFKIIMNPFLSYGRFTCKMRVKEVDSDGWVLGEKKIDLTDVGLRSNGLANIGDTITQRLVKYVNTSTNLMPSVYRHSDGKERFYNAINYPFPKYEGFDETLEEDNYGEDGIQRNALGEYEIDGMIHNDAYKEADGKYIVFKNPYFEGTPKEHSISVEDLKPTIKEAVNSMGLRMDMFSEFAYDLDDNDETEESDSESSRDFKHSYFFGKLRKLDFNLFEHAIEQQPMTISFTSGDCGACNFEIGVTEEFPQKNPVQVDADGNLVRDEQGRVVCGQFAPIEESKCQPQQQDTINNEVWIALKKEEQTYGILMPKATTKEEGENGEIIEIGGHRPKACTVNEDGTPNNDGDTFVILGINLPDEYIYRAEDKLRDEIIKYIKENNEEKFTFSITFSRIFFEENPAVLEYLNENSRLNVAYNGKTYTLYVTSYSYNMGEGDALPEIKVELDDKLTVSQNALQNAISEVKSEVNMAFANFDVLAYASPYFLRRDVDDTCNSTIDFKKGIKFGEGGKVEVLDNNSAKLTIEYLEVTKKASFTSLEIKEKTHVGGQIIISPAATTCGEVEELEDAYRCYFQTKDEDGGDEIFNQFVVNDLAICQTYNAWGSRYYWRKVVGVGEDYIDLSKTLCDEYSDVPMAGDKIVQLGNTEDIARQAAQVLSAYGEDAPSFIMYNGINDFTLADKNITGIIWNPKTLEPQMYSYGSFFFGDSRTDENGNPIGNFITFQKRKKEDGTYEQEKTLHINANVTIGANSSGLTNLSEWKEAEDKINEASQGVTLIQQDVQNLQDQIDGVVENHFYEGVPTIDNYPAIQWTTDEEKNNHIGDTYINIASEEQDPDNAGKAWRWAFTDNEHTGYHWHPIADTDAVKALLEAYKAQAGIDDLQYLKGTFAKSVDVDGVVMSEMVAVKNSEGEIEAFFNGSDNEDFIDTTHGKMILAGGIPEGSDDIKERSKEAKTRLYEDGHFETKDGKMELMQVNSMRSMVSQIDGMGYMLNEEPWYIKEFNEYNGKPNSPDDIIIGGYSNAPQKKVIMAGFVMDWETEPDIAWGIDQIGRRRTFIHHKNSSGFEAYWCTLKTPDYDERPNDTSGLYPPYFYVDGTPRKSLKICANDCIELYGYGYHTKEDRSAGVFMGWIVTNRTPIFGGVNKYHLSGMQEGLRPKMRTITSSETLSELDHSIMVISPTSITIKLPEDPEIGQVIECYMAHLPSAGYSVTFDGNGTGIQDPLDDTWGLSSVDVNPSGVIRLVCAYDQYGTKRWWFYRLL